MKKTAQAIITTRTSFLLPWRAALLDTRNIIRERMLLGFITLIPGLIILVNLFGVPLLAARYPAFAPWALLFELFVTSQAAFISGFVFAFVILDEKDAGLLPVYRILPCTFKSFINYRLLYCFVLGFTVSVLTLLSTGVKKDIITLLLISAVFAQQGVFICLVITSRSKNKVEGLTWYKGINTLLILPLLTWFVPGKAIHLLAVIPTYSAFRFAESAGRNGAEVALPALTGSLLVTGLLCWWLYRTFMQRNASG